MSPRGVAAVTLAVLLVGLGVATAVTTPWRPLGDVSAADRVAPRVAGDFTPQEVATSEQLLHRSRPPAYLGLAVGLLVVLALGLTPLGSGLVEQVAGRVGGRWLPTTVLATVLLLVLVRLATLPFGAWSEQVSRSAGLSTRSWATWLVDVAKGFGINAVVTVLVVVAVVGLARAMPTWWWAPAAVGAALLVVALSFVYPLVVEPVFNRFTPLRDGPLRTSLLELAEQDGVAVDDVLVADASRRTTTLNAYVSGFGSSRRIVVYDTLLADAPPDEVRLVVAHELGHAKRNDVLTGTLLGALGVAAGVVALGLLLSWRALLDLAEVRSAGDPRVVALLLALVAAGTFLGGPLQNLVSRHIEARADVHALDLTRDPTTFAQMQRRLAVTARSDLTPPWLAYVWFASHPSAPQRIAMARTWAAAHDQPVPGPLVGSGG
jgi:STE24 endopeptidase